MHDKPVALEDFCIDALCDSVHALCESEKNFPDVINTDTSVEKNSFTNAGTFTAPFQQSVESFAFSRKIANNIVENSNEIIIPVCLSDKLLMRLSEKRQLSNKTLQFFTSKRTTLKNVKIKDSPVNIIGLSVLKQHSLDTLKLINVKDIQFEQFLEKCVSRETFEILKCLDLSGTLRSTSIRTNISAAAALENLSSENPASEMEIIVDNVNLMCQFRNVRALSVAETQFSDSGLIKISQNLNFLEYLDISHTRVTDVQPLRVFNEQLKTLLMHRPRVRNIHETVQILCNLNKLEVLDISDSPKTTQTCATDISRGQLGVLLVQNCINQVDARLPKLRILDLSGSQANFDVNVFSNFLANHNYLEYCGLLMSNACYFDSVLALKCLKVSGEANRKQIFVSLETYWSRDIFCSRSMYLLFNMLQDDYENLTVNEKHFCIEHIIKGLASNLNSLSVQMAGTACLYNLCRGDRSHNVHPILLRQIIECSLTSIETHCKASQYIQLHKNIWLTLCNDHILQSGTFDMFRCCMAALESMVRCSDNSVTRMTVAIVSILAAKIPTELTSKLGTNHNYMKFLLQVVNQKVETQLTWYKDNAPAIRSDPLFEQQAPVPDITLKFTLSALWNLTDESPATCLCLLDENGLEIVLKVLDVFREHSVETKVLGLLNNVAEVPDLKGRLVNANCLNIIGRLLKSIKIDVSYFSAGILAHLCADQKWENMEPSWKSCLENLEVTIKGWAQPETEMVAYRSFKPFFSLLAKDHLPAVQLWAVWAIRHVCLKNTDRYVDMFKTDGGQEALERVRIATEHSYPMISCICQDLIKLLV